MTETRRNDSLAAVPAHPSPYGATHLWAPHGNVRLVARVSSDLAHVSVVIPTLNEAANLPHVMSRLPPGLREVILVDGGSTDGTEEVARQLMPDLKVVRQEGRGKGDALRCGFEACTGDVIVMLDADGSTDPSEIPRFLQAIDDGADFAKGSRFLAGGGSEDLTRWRRLGNAVLCGVVNLLYGTKYTDLCYGYNAFRRSCLGRLAIDCPGFEVETLINVRIAKLDLRVAEVPSFEAERLHGASKLHPIRDGVRVLRTVLRERFTRGSRPAVSGVADVLPARSPVGSRSGGAGNSSADPMVEIDGVPSSAG